MESKNEQKKPTITLVSGNKSKLKEFKAIIGDIVNLDIQDVDLPELQGEPQEVAAEKAKLAYKELKRPLIVEDTSLCYNALNGMPGPYIKWFLKKLKPVGLHKLLHGFKDKSAYSQCIVGYIDESCLEKPHLFVGQTPGQIVKPRGETDFGWDPVFQPDGFQETYAEMDKKIKNKISHRFKAVTKFAQYFMK